MYSIKSISWRQRNSSSHFGFGFEQQTNNIEINDEQYNKYIYYGKSHDVFNSNIWFAFFSLCSSQYIFLYLFNYNKYDFRLSLKASSSTNTFDIKKISIRIANTFKWAADEQWKTSLFYFVSLFALLDVYYVFQVLRLLHNSNTFIHDYYPHSVSKLYYFDSKIEFWWMNCMSVCWWSFYFNQIESIRLSFVIYAFNIQFCYLPNTFVMDCALIFYEKCPSKFILKQNIAKY